MIGRTKRNGGDLVTRREREVRREGRGGRDVAVRAGARRPQTVRVRPAVMVAAGSVADDVAHSKDGALDEGEREEEQEEEALPRELPQRRARLRRDGLVAELALELELLDVDVALKEGLVVLRLRGHGSGLGTRAEGD